MITGDDRAMRTFNIIKTCYGVYWTTVQVGWKGYGVLSPWPERWVEFPPLISTAELTTYANKRFESVSDYKEQDLIIALLENDLNYETREEILDQLLALSELDNADPVFELRKWRLVFLEQLLENMSRDPLHGLLELTEFWQNWGFPSDSPHVVQGIGNDIAPAEYYRDDNLNRIIIRHQDWIENERASIKSAQPH